MKTKILVKAVFAFQIFNVLQGYGQILTPTTIIKPSTLQTARKFTLTTFKPTAVAQPMAVTITTDPSFSSPVKTEFTQETVSGCKITPIKYQMSSEKIGTFFITSGKEINVYPGAVYRASEITSEAFRPYHLEYARNPMDLTTDILAFDNPTTSRKSGAPRSNLTTINVNEFDFGTINNKWNTLLGNSINGTTAGNVKKYLQVVESAQQLKSDFQSTSQVDVTTKIGVEVPTIPVSVGLDNKVSVNTAAMSSATLSSSKNTILLKYEQVFYSARISPKAGFANFYSTIANSALEDDLVYVKTVDYGMIYYISITSTASKSDILNAVKTAVSTSTGVSANFPIEGVPVTTEVGVGTSNTSMSSTAAQNILNTSTIRVYQWGGEIVNDLNGDLGSIVTQLNNRKTFSASNLGKPIAYTLGFVKDGANGWINYDSKYASANCGNNAGTVKYDVDLELDHIDVANIGDLSHHEDLYGHLAFTYLKANSKEVNTDINYWSQTEDKAGETFFTEGTRHVDVNHNLINNLTLSELQNISLYLAGELHDDEGIAFSRNFKCQDCNEFSGDYGKRKIYFSEMTTTQSAINNLPVDNQYHELAFGGDNFLELNFYESGNKSDGWVRAMWKVKVKAHN